MLSKLSRSRSPRRHAGLKWFVRSTPKVRRKRRRFAVISARKSIVRKPPVAEKKEGDQGSYHTFPTEAARSHDAQFKHTELTERTNQVAKPKPEYLNWKPSEIDLRTHVVKKALSRWQEVCTYLGLTHEQVKAADANNPRNVQQAFFESLMHWHSGCTTNPVNWESVLKALNASELTEVAKNIQTELAGQQSHLVPGPSTQSAMSPVNRLERSPELHSASQGDQQNEIFFPELYRLERVYGHLMATLAQKIHDMEESMRICVSRLIQQLLRKPMHGVRMGDMPDVPTDSKELYSYIAKRSNCVSPSLIQEVVTIMCIDELSEKWKDYVRELATCLGIPLYSGRRKKVPLIEAEDLMSMSVKFARNPEQFPISRVIALQKYFQESVALDIAIFEGYTSSSTVLYFAIPKTAVPFMPSLLLSHVAPLKRLEVQKIVVFGYFAVDLEVAQAVALHVNDNFPPNVEENVEPDDEGKIKEATDSNEPLSRVQELEDELKNSEWKWKDLTQVNMALVNRLKVCQEQKDHTEQENASLKKRLVSMLSSQGGADKDSALTTPSDVRSKRIPRRWWLKVSAGIYDTSLLPSSSMKQAEGSREMEGEVVFRRDTKSNLLKAVSGTEWMYRRGAQERGRRANLRRHQFTHYHRRWLADNVQKEEEDSCKLWLLQSSPDVGTVRERQEHGVDEGKMSEKVTGSGELLSRVQELEDELKDSEQKRMDLIQSNTALQKILKTCRQQKARAQQEITSLWERLGGADKDSALTTPSAVCSKRIPSRWWLKVSAGCYDTSLLPSFPTEQAEGGKEMGGEVVFRRDTKSSLLKAVSGTEWIYQRGALERGRRSANLHQHQFTRYHRSWLADNVQKEEEESCKQWLLRSSPDVDSVREGEEQGPMSKVYRQALRDYQEKIAGVLIVENIISDLEPYLTKEEYLQVESKLGNMAQVDELFRILLTKENRHFKGFCHVLEDNGYQHWAQQLRSSTDGAETEELSCAEGENEPLREALKQAKGILSTRLPIEFLSFLLISKKVISSQEYQYIRGEHNSVNKSTMLLDMMEKKSIPDIRNFLKILKFDVFCGYLAEMVERDSETLVKKHKADSGTTDATPNLPEIKADYMEIKRTLVHVCTTQTSPTLEEVKSLCIDLLECDFHKIPRMSGHMSEIREATTMGDVMRIVCFRLSNWLSYDFLRRVIAEFQPTLQSVADKLACYESKLKPLLLQKLGGIKELQQREEAPKTMAELIVKHRLDADGLFVKDLIAERHFLAERLDIPPHLLQVLSWRPG